MDGMDAGSNQLSFENTFSIVNEVLSDEQLELILFPTEQCNFRCTYCYEDFSLGKMKPSVISGVKKLIISRAPDLKHLAISWFGGEPLIALDVVRDVSSLAVTLAQKHAFVPSIGVTTNGWHLDAKNSLDLFLCGVRKYQVSLDGDRSEHDKTRRRANQEGSFERIWNNLISLNGLMKCGQIVDTKIMLRVHVKPDNIESVKRLMCSIQEDLSPEFFHVYLKNVGHYGGVNDKTFEIIKKTDLEFRQLSDYARAEFPSFFPVDSKSLSDSFLPPICYAAKANAFAIRADGSIAKCTVALNDSRNKIGYIKEDGSLDLDGSKAGAWLYPLSTMKMSDLACPIGSLPRTA